MKKVILILMLLVASMQPAFSQDGFSYNGSPTSVPFKDKTIRPKDLSERIVECSYAYGELSVAFEQPEGRATMTVTRMEDGVSQTVVFYTFTMFSYNIGTAPGSYVINVKTSQCEYEGFLTIE